MNRTKLSEIETAIDDLNREEQWLLIEHIAGRLRQGEKKHGQPLYGLWQGKFPDDIDLDRDLAEIRHDWLKRTERLDP